MHFREAETLFESSNRCCHPRHIFCLIEGHRRCQDLFLFLRRILSDVLNLPCFPGLRSDETCWETGTLSQWHLRHQLLHSLLWRVLPRASTSHWAQRMSGRGPKLRFGRSTMHADSNELSHAITKVWTGSETPSDAARQRRDTLAARKSLLCSHSE